MKDTGLVACNLANPVMGTPWSYHVSSDYKKLSLSFVSVSIEFSNWLAALNADLKT